MKMKHTLAALMAVLWMMAGTGFAADGQESPWQFGVTVPLWAAGIDGDVTVQGVKQDVKINFDQLKEHLDASFALGLEARKGKFGLYTGVGYMKFSADGTAAGGTSADTELKFLIADAGASYRLAKAGEEHPFILEALAGIRYWHTEADSTIKDPAGVVLFDGGKKRDLLDPVVGLRASQYLTQKLHLDVQGDIGGFGISDNQADLDWSATGLVSYDVAKWFSLSAGYKALALDFSRGSGASENGANIIMNGFLLAARFNF
jgi:hypothetical protein